jgi:hypothetical protein
VVERTLLKVIAGAMCGWQCRRPVYHLIARLVYTRGSV